MFTDPFRSDLTMENVPDYARGMGNGLIKGPAGSGDPTASALAPEARHDAFHHEHGGELDEHRGRRPEAGALRGCNPAVINSVARWLIGCGVRRRRYHGHRQLPAALPHGGRVPCTCFDLGHRPRPRAPSQPCAECPFYCCVQGLFAPFGDIFEAKIVRNHRDGRSLGYGFVSFVTEDAARGAILGMNGYEVRGKSAARVMTPRFWMFAPFWGVSRRRTLAHTPVSCGLPLFLCGVALPRVSGGGKVTNVAFSRRQTFEGVGIFAANKDE